MIERLKLKLISASGRLEYKNREYVENAKKFILQ